MSQHAKRVRGQDRSLVKDVAGVVSLMAESVSRVMDQAPMNVEYVTAQDNSTSRAMRVKGKGSKNAGYAMERVFASRELISRQEV